MKYFIPLIALLIAGCGHTTLAGLSYGAGQGSQDNPDAVQSAQLDAAWAEAVNLWGPADPNQVIVLLWDKPIQYGRELDAGATWGSQVNVYVQPGHEGCLFLPGNEGTLEHELGHAILYLQGNVLADPTHADARWHAVDGIRQRLYEKLCR